MNARPSRTAEFVALFRALETCRAPDSRLVNDPFAEGFLPPLLRLVVFLSSLPFGARIVEGVIDQGWPGARGNAVARTRFIDDALRDALDDGVGQVVILGAGFDSRPYRIPGIERTRVFEVDHPTTQAIKQERLKQRIGPLPEHVVFLPVDFNRQSLAEAMAASGFSPSKRSFFIWEGVTNYLTAEAVDATLRHIALAAAPGSRLLFTYVQRDILHAPGTFEGARELMSAVRSVGEPYTFGFDTAELPTYLGERGFALVTDVGAPEYRKRYLESSGRGMKLLDFYRAALVEIRPGSRASASPRGGHSGPQSP